MKKITKVIQVSRCNLPNLLMMSGQSLPTSEGQTKPTSDEGVHKSVNNAKQLDNVGEADSFVVNLSNRDDEIVFGEGFYNTPSLVIDTSTHQTVQRLALNLIRFKIRMIT